MQSECLLRVQNQVLRFAGRGQQTNNIDQTASLVTYRNIEDFRAAVDTGTGQHGGQRHDLAGRYRLLDLSIIKARLRAGRANTGQTKRQSNGQGDKAF